MGNRERDGEESECAHRGLHRCASKGVLTVARIVVLCGDPCATDATGALFSA